MAMTEGDKSVYERTAWKKGAISSHSVESRQDGDVAARQGESSSFLELLKVSLLLVKTFGADCKLARGAQHPPRAGNEAKVGPQVFDVCMELVVTAPANIIAAPMGSCEHGKMDCAVVSTAKPRRYVVLVRSPEMKERATEIRVAHYVVASRDFK